MIINYITQIRILSFTMQKIKLRKLTNKEIKKEINLFKSLFFWKWPSYITQWWAGWSLIELGRIRINSLVIYLKWGGHLIFFLGNLIFLEFHNKVGLVFSFNWQSMSALTTVFCWHSICIYYFIFSIKHICCTETL